MVSAELALTIPALLLVVALVAQALSLMVVQVECVDAARAGARAAARGEPPREVHEAALEVAPEGARVVVARSGETITVRVRAARGGPASWIGLTPSGQAVARVEPT